MTNSGMTYHVTAAIQDESHAAIGAKMRLNVESARIEFDAIRRDEPHALTEIRYKLILKSPEPPEKLQGLADLCFKWGTVMNTLVNGLTPHGALVLE
jgi:uncharacterized OsmC-like protein